MNCKPTIVFAPGAWHSPDSFRLVRNALQAKGWETDAVTYPSVGAEPPTYGIADDATALRNILEPLADQGKQIVLVVHSYGGLVGAQAVRGLGYKQRQKEGRAGGIITFLYLTAFVTPAGKSILKLLGGVWLPWMRGSYVFADTPEEILYHDVPTDLQKEAVDALTHECIRAWTDEVDYEPWHDMHCLYFICEEDRAVPAAVQEQMAQILGPGFGYLPEQKLALTLPVSRSRRGGWSREGGPIGSDECLPDPWHVALESVTQIRGTASAHRLDNMHS